MQRSCGLMGWATKIQKAGGLLAWSGKALLTFLYALVYFFPCPLVSLLVLLEILVFWTFFVVVFCVFHTCSFPNSVIILCRLATLKASRRGKEFSQCPLSTFCQTKSNQKTWVSHVLLQDWLLARSQQLLPTCNSVHNCGYICIYNCCYRTRTHLWLTLCGDLYLYCK